MDRNHGDHAGAWDVVANATHRPHGLPRALSLGRSGSKVPDIPHRGYQLIQKIIRGDNVGGIEIDRNLTVNDNFGQSVLWLYQNAAIESETV